LVVKILAENNPERSIFSLRGIGLGFYLRNREIRDPAAAQRSAPSHIITDGYLKVEGGRSGLIDR
jgi:hypothetical protein